MDNKLLLVKSITLLYRENLLEKITENSSDLIRTVLEDIKLNEIKVGLNTEQENGNIQTVTTYKPITKRYELSGSNEKYKEYKMG